MTEPEIKKCSFCGTPGKITGAPDFIGDTTACTMSFEPAPILTPEMAMVLFMIGEDLLGHKVQCPCSLCKAITGVPDNQWTTIKRIAE